MKTKKKFLDTVTEIVKSLFSIIGIVVLRLILSLLNLIKNFDEPNIDSFLALIHINPQLSRGVYLNNLGLCSDLTNTWKCLSSDM